MGKVIKQEFDWYDKTYRNEPEINIPVPNDATDINFVIHTDGFYAEYTDKNGDNVKVGYGEF